MNQVGKLKKLSNLSYFDKNTLSQFIDISDNSLYANIKRWLKSGVLIQLKKGLYVSADFFKTLKGLDAYVEFVANKLHGPSYLSTEYILQKHSMLSEAAYGLTSVALKSTRSYKNSLGIFMYRNIKPALFKGYTIREKDGFQITSATKAKALFDFFYYRLLRAEDVNDELIESFRLNYDPLT